MYYCRYCHRVCKNDNSLRNHERLCKQNPTGGTANTSRALEKANAKTECCQYCNELFSLGNIKKHTISCKKNPSNFKECPVCNKEHSKDGITCSYSCSNKYFRHGRKGGTQYKTDDRLIANKQYQQLCFRHHGKKCIVCGEEKIVAVHHINENHFDNRVENLVPLCPTHHQYVHSRYKNEVIPIIENFIKNRV